MTKTSMGRMPFEKIEKTALAPNFRHFVKKDLANMQKGGKRLGQQTAAQAAEEMFGLRIEDVFCESVTDFPIDIKPSAVLQELLQSLNLQKASALIGPRVRAVLQLSSTAKLFNSLFWLVFVSAFQTDSTHLFAPLRKQVTESFFNLFRNTEPPREQIFKCLPFLFAEAIVIGCEKGFLSSKPLFDDGFVVWVYRLVISELVGYSLHPLTVHDFRKSALDRSRFIPPPKGVSGLGGVDLFFQTRVKPIREKDEDAAAKLLEDKEEEVEEDYNMIQSDPSEWIDTKSKLKTVNVSPIIMLQDPEFRLFTRCDPGRPLSLTDPIYESRHREHRMQMQIDQLKQQTECSALGQPARSGVTYSRYLGAYLQSQKQNIEAEKAAKIDDSVLGRLQNRAAKHDVSKESKRAMEEGEKAGQGLFKPGEPAYRTLLFYDCKKRKAQREAVPFVPPPLFDPDAKQPTAAELLTSMGFEVSTPTNSTTNSSSDISSSTQSSPKAADGDKNEETLQNSGEGLTMTLEATEKSVRFG